jgi:hypothetical protein
MRALQNSGEFRRENEDAYLDDMPGYAVGQLVGVVKETMKPG